MSKYRGPRLRLVRKLGELPGLTTKMSKKQNTPGEHGQPKNKLLKNRSPYGVRLLEKQKIRFNYNITERQLLRYVKQAKKLTGSTGDILLRILEMRLDNIVYRLGMAPTIIAARQLVSHGHILVNKKKINIPSYPCQLKSVISVKEKKASRDLVTKFVNESATTLLPSHLSFNKENLVGVVNSVVTRDWIGLQINELLVVEYYSRD
uniref:ribosomal protein S4 n=1 Tax=Gayralia brasiliensis TaxID=1286870 RepID=UPI0024113439|nr:ribosomal protein S4 [Gayralia brasiliensis]YP_010733762.1 ribosomal protein S4 [Monostroma nitidum]WEG92959.1 ribosomal protein S4 [Gayralia brasiliensis]WEG93033.1 ribosomal protein S4 [Monostroma nitidum]